MATPDESFHLMLRIQGPGAPGRIEDLVRDAYVIGRGDPTGAVHADFTIPEDDALSRAHCRLHKTGPTYAVENLSPNGTQVNGKAISKIVPLKHKDRISLGERTTLEFLAVTDEERSRELQAAAGGTAERRGAPKRKKPFWQRPLFLGVVFVYGAVMLALMSSSEETVKRFPDPGNGPYFSWMLKAPLQWDNDADSRRRQGEAMWDAKARERTPADLRATITERAWEAARLREKIPETQRRDLAQAEWKRTLAEHGGDVTGSGAHAYYLLEGGLRVLGLAGYLDLAAGIDNKDDVAMVLVKVLEGLEARLTQLHDEADRFVLSKHWGLAREKYERILEAVPSAQEPIQRFAAERYARLAKVAKR